MNETTRKTNFHDFIRTSQLLKPNNLQINPIYRPQCRRNKIKRNNVLSVQHWTNYHVVIITLWITGVIHWITGYKIETNTENITRRVAYHMNTKSYFINTEDVTVIRFVVSSLLISSHFWLGFPCCNCRCHTLQLAGVPCWAEIGNMSLWHWFWHRVGYTRYCCPYQTCNLFGSFWPCWKPFHKQHYCWEWWAWLWRILGPLWLYLSSRLPVPSAHPVYLHSRYTWVGQPLVWFGILHIPLPLWRSCLLGWFQRISWLPKILKE